MAIKKLQIKLKHLISAVMCTYFIMYDLYEYVIEMEIDEPAHY